MRAIPERLRDVSSGGAIKKSTTDIFLPHDAMCKRGLWSGPVSVCLSVTFVLSILTAEDIVKLLCRPGSPIVLVF